MEGEKAKAEKQDDKEEEQEEEEEEEDYSGTRNFLLASGGIFLYGLIAVLFYGLYGPDQYGALRAVYFAVVTVSLGL